MKKMKEINAIGVSAGMREGTAFILEKKPFIIPNEPAADPVRELERFEAALAKVTHDTRETLYAAQMMGHQSNTGILNAYLTLLEDPATTGGVRVLIKKAYNAPLAVREAIGGIVRMFEGMDDAYMRDRAFDIRDIMNVLIRELLGIKAQDVSMIPPGSVIVAEELSTTDTAKMDMDNIAGIITVTGGRNSHVSIVARSYEIPAIVGASHAPYIVNQGDDILIDGGEGRAYISPTDEARERFNARNAIYLWEKELYKSFAGRRSATKDGCEVRILANISASGEIRRVVDSTAAGIGLYRSEFLFMGLSKSPDENVQYRAYREAAAAMTGKPVTIRTLDVGGDKRIDYLNAGPEDNPAIGCRSIRLCLNHPDLFGTQLKAILRAGKYGNVRILFPFISSVDEICSAKEALEKAKSELRREGKEFDENIKAGVMIELPAAVLIARELAAECDFFTIGTNDLIQHSLAVDRANSHVSNIYSHYHPAVLRLVEHTIRCAEESGIECGMCGEAAGDPIMIPALIGMGLRHFSMNAGEILRARAVISAVNTHEAAALAREALGKATSRDVRWTLEDYSEKMRPMQ